MVVKPASYLATALPFAGEQQAVERLVYKIKLCEMIKKYFLFFLEPFFSDPIEVEVCKYGRAMGTNE